MPLWNRISSVLRVLGRPLEQAWDKILVYSERYLRICALFYRLLAATFTGPACRGIIIREIARQVYFTAMQTAHILVFSSLMLGLVVIVHATQLVSKIKGFDDWVGWLLVTIVVREVGPVWAALFVLLHSSGAVTVELGTMAVTGEIEALQIAGIDPYRFLGVPRFWGITISLVCLYVLSAIAAVIGGFLFSQIFADIFWSQFWQSFIHNLQWVDLNTGFTKAILFGMLISTVAIYLGFGARGDMRDVARNTSRGPLWSLVLCGSLDIIMTTAYYI